MKGDVDTSVLVSALMLILLGGFQDVCEQAIGEMGRGEKTS